MRSEEEWSGVTSLSRPGGVKETAGLVGKAKEKLGIISQKFRLDLITGELQKTVSISGSWTVSWSDRRTIGNILTSGQHHQLDQLPCQPHPLPGA